MVEGPAELEFTNARNFKVLQQLFSFMAESTKGRAKVGKPRTRVCNKCLLFADTGIDREATECRPNIDRESTENLPRIYHSGSGARRKSTNTFCVNQQKAQTLPTFRVCIALTITYL